MTNVIFKSVIIFGLLAFPTVVGAQDKTDGNTQSNVPLPPPGPYLSINNSLASPLMAVPSAQNSDDQKETAQPVKDGEFPPANFDPQADGSQQNSNSGVTAEPANNSDTNVKSDAANNPVSTNNAEQNKPVYAPQGTAKSLEEPKGVTPTASQNNTTAPQPNVNDYAPLPQFNAPTWAGNGEAATNDNSTNVPSAPSNNPANSLTKNQQMNPPAVNNPQPNVPQFSNNNGWQNNNRQNQQWNNGQNNGWNNSGNNRQNNGWNNGQNNNSYNRQNQQFQQRNQNFQNGYGGNWQQQNRNFRNWNNNNFQGNRNQYQNNQQQQPQFAPRSSIIVKNKLIDLS